MECGDVDGFVGANSGGERGDVFGGVGFEYDVDVFVVVNLECGECGVEIVYGDDFIVL